ncbi:MAG: NADP-dependent oxidoreductase [Proteobacteria bacterium]|nr:NADP-dependent oxidoreductase [Pseudomonadota bacterium]
MPAINRQWLLARRPAGMVGTADFACRESPLPVPDLAAGEILVKTLMLSFEPAMRGWMDDKPSYMPPVVLGEPMRAAGIGQVVQSANPAFPVGSLAMGFLNWQEYAVANRAGEMPPMPVPAGTPLTLPLGAFGGASLTAYFGLLEVGRPKAGETVVVSGAAGAVGSVVAQIARIQGCRVIGIAGGAEKCAWLRDTCGLDGVIDYKHEDVAARLAEICPMGIDVFFDNVGGDILEAAIEQIADHSRIVLCGAIATYNDAQARPGPRNLMNLVTRRVRMEGFVMVDYVHRIAEAQPRLAEWVTAGRIRCREDVQEGFENIPATFLRLFSGANQGKQLLKLADPA